MTENYPLSQNKLLEDANNIRSLTGPISSKDYLYVQSKDYLKTIYMFYLKTIYMF